MNHTWKKDDNYKPEFLFVEKCECTRCGCVRHKSVYKVNGLTTSDYSYDRNGIRFNYRPECLDWDDDSITSDEIMMFW